MRTHTDRIALYSLDQCGPTVGPNWPMNNYGDYERVVIHPENS